MDREKFVTIILGLIVGIILAAGYFFGTKFLPGIINKSKPTAATTARVAPKPQIQKNNEPNSNVSLSISTPDDNSATTDKSVKVTGSFFPNSTLILFANLDENIATSDAQGKFTFDVDLEGGENEITVSSFDNNGKLATIKRNVTLEVSE